MTGVVTGILNAERIFGVPAFAPVIWNLVIIVVAGHVRPPRLTRAPGHRSTRSGILVATVVQFLIPLPLLRGPALGAGLPARLRQPARAPDPAADDPRVAGPGADQRQPDAGHRDRDPLQRRPRRATWTTPSGCSCCRRACSRWRSRRCCSPRSGARGGAARPDRARRIVAHGVRAIMFLLLPAAAISIVLAEPIVRLLYQHGEFDATTPRGWRTLVAFSLGLIGNGLSLLLTRAFFGLQEPRIPTSRGARQPGPESGARPRAAALRRGRASRSPRRS